MRRTIVLALFTIIFQSTRSQKPALDHSVYDGWESIGERAFSPDGKYLIYTVVPQEGDGRLVIRSTEGSYAKEIPRGAVASITSDSRWVILHIKPFFKDTREARIKKKTPDQMPRDTLAWLELGKDSVIKIPRVHSYKIPEKEGSWLAWLQEKALPGGRSDSVHGRSDSARVPDSLTRIRQLAARADSLIRVADSLRGKIHEIGVKGFSALGSGSTAGGGNKGRSGENVEEGTVLVLRDLNTGKERRFSLVSEYAFSKNGRTLVIETTRKNGDSLVKALVLWVRPGEDKVDTVMRGFNDAKNYALDEQGSQLAFVAERDSVAKALIKYYRLWYYTPGMDSATIRGDRSLIGQAINGSMTSGRTHLTISPDYVNNFSKDGSRLYLGLAPIRPPKDTNRVDFETARLDVWNYQDDYLSPQQLTQLSNELKRSYLATIARTDGRLVVLGDENCENVGAGGEGNGPYALGSSSKGYRIQEQWEESGLEKLYLIDVRDGSRKLVQDKVRGGGTLSPGEQFILWYDWHQRNWFTYAIADGRVRNITAGIRYPLYDEEDDHPDDPPPHGIMGWDEGDRWVYIYDKYDIWRCDPAGRTAPVNMTRGVGRAAHNTIRYVSLDKDERFIRNGQLVLLRNFDTKAMSGGARVYKWGSDYMVNAITYPVSYNGFFKAKDCWRLGFLQGSFDKPYDIYVTQKVDTTLINNLVVADSDGPRAFSHINPQQTKYNWFTVELHHWKMLDGKPTDGLLYKPENFDSTRKYPIIFYFYERDAETMYNYITPQPVRASINIPYFASNGYLVFDPNIWYKTGQPGEDAYNSIMSAVRYLASRYKWIDTTKMALQGHSWGGYQTAYMVTRTNKFAAAEAGAPVANMTSAYGGIRWGTGISRQFQYEKSQSRLGATLWQRPDLYLKNSPLFRADKVTTPLLMMHNDADGAVPWYQGIEFFTALRRLGKKVWLLQYNGEDHGLTERRNRKDWSIRLAQFFGYYLKGEPPAKWIKEGVPATLKGVDWGLGTD